MSLRRMFDGVECARFGDDPDPVTARKVERNKVTVITHEDAKPVLVRTNNPSAEDKYSKPEDTKSAGRDRPKLPDDERAARRKAQKAAANRKRKGC